MKRESLIVLLTVIVFVVASAAIVGWSVLKRGHDGGDSSLIRVFTDENFRAEVVEKSKTHPILVDFYADWCFPCQMLNPVLHEVAKELEGKAVIGKVNIDKNILPRKFGVKTIPTMFIIRDGEVKQLFRGVVTKERIVKALEKHGA